MKNIKMADLHGQYLKIKPEIDSAIQEVLTSTAFINGPQVKEFNNNLASYLGARHVVGCANGTDALQIAIMALDLKPGDEVISPDFTFIATVEVVALLGLVPVIVDVDPVTFTIDPDKIRKAITSKTKAIIPVHLYGMCANMGEILSIAKENNLAVIEDTAQAIGGNYFDEKYKGKAGTIGTIGCTSFFPSKNLGCFGDGGALITNDDQLAERIRCIANHGAKVKYYHDEIGVNSRLDTLQAAILNVKLRHLNEYAKARQRAANFYDSQLAGIERVITPTTPSYTDHVFHQYTIKIDGDRDALKNYLAKQDIPTMIYYPVPMHRQKAFNVKGNFPVSDALAKSVLSLPMHTELTTDEQDYICDKIQAFLKR
jgi:UDP-2-acetamido-2-deoxy-ribo-hexuluronate aminotransferase